MSVVASSLPVEDFVRRDTLPPVEVLRPARCPACGNPSYPPGQPLGLIGHGTYRRRVLGLDEDRDGLLIWVRRYLCTQCGGTTSVLPCVLYPGRQYAGIAILISLVLLLLRGKCAGEVRSHITGSEEGHGWRSLSRWRRQVLAPLWGWTARQLGINGHPTSDRSAQTQRLNRLLGLLGQTSACLYSTDAELAMMSAELARGWSSSRDPPG